MHGQAIKKITRQNRNALRGMQPLSSCSPSPIRSPRKVFAAIISLRVECRATHTERQDNKAESTHFSRITFQRQKRRIAPQQLSAIFLKAKILAEKGNHMILETVSHLTRVRAFIHFKAVRDSALIKDFVQLAGIDS